MSERSLQSYHNIKSYHNAVTKLRGFFLDKGFLEVETQSRRSILAACEDPKTISTYSFAGTKWPLPQTGQMWLEHELLKNPDVPGIFCSTTSYRDEPNPIASRHLNIFPMFEFETHGDIQALQKLFGELFEWLGFGPKELYRDGEYTALAQHYNTKEIESEHELRMWKDFGPVFLLKNFPIFSSPFWNMKKEGSHAKKIDAILYGMETIGSAERSTNPDEMREQFLSISDGLYADLLYKHFGKERVEQELNDYLSLDFFPRCGAGIGVTRMIRALTLAQEEQPHASIMAQKPTQLNT